MIVPAEKVLFVPEGMTVEALCDLLKTYPDAEITAMWHDEQMRAVAVRFRFVADIAFPQLDQAQIDAVFNAGDAQQGGEA